MGAKVEIKIYGEYKIFPAPRAGAGGWGNASFRIVADGTPA